MEKLLVDESRLKMGLIIYWIYIAPPLRGIIVGAKQTKAFSGSGFLNVSAQDQRSWLLVALTATFISYTMGHLLTTSCHNKGQLYWTWLSGRIAIM